MEHTAAVIAGGGLAGLTAALHLKAQGYPVILLEKHSYPRHKVCGEYVSCEVLPYLKALQVDVASLSPAHIDTMEFSLKNGKSVRCKLPLGGVGISRYTLDSYMADTAVQAGCELRIDAVTSARFHNGQFQVETASGAHISSNILIGAYGKRSELDKALHRPFIQQKSPWVAQKFHISGGALEPNVVGLHHFPGGYCGVSAVEQGRFNLCFISTYDAFKKAGGRAEPLLRQNANLAKILAESQRLTDTLSIGQISFARKSSAENGWLMVGDTAGMIHPLCGNGMAMAIHSAQLACLSALDFLNGRCTLAQAQRQYSNAYRHQFSQRLSFGRMLASLLEWPFGTAAAFAAVQQFPFMLPRIVQKTHGQPLTPFSL